LLCVWHEPWAAYGSRLDGETSRVFISAFQEIPSKMEQNSWPWTTLLDPTKPRHTSQKRRRLRIHRPFLPTPACLPGSIITARAQVLSNNRERRPIWAGSFRPDRSARRPRLSQSNHGSRAPPWHIDRVPIARASTGVTNLAARYLLFLTEIIKASEDDACLFSWMKEAHASSAPKAAAVSEFPFQVAANRARTYY
jgi:hypothetical protein